MNREIFPGGVYPLQGDVQSVAGATKVTVTGLQSVSVTSAALSGGERLEYNPNTVSWTPTLKASIQVNGVTVSDDPWVSVNLPKPIKVNGS